MRYTAPYAVLIVIAFFFSSHCAGQTARSSATKKNIDGIVKHLQRIDNLELRFSGDPGIGDSINAANKALLNYLKKACTGNTALLGDRLGDLKKSGMDILTADDGKFRIYCWTTRGNGMFATSYDAVAQFATHNGTGVKVLNDDWGAYNSDEVCSGSSYRQVYTVSVATGQNIYLVVTRDPSRRAITFGITACRIDGDKLLMDLPLFKTTTKTLKSISFFVDYDLKANEDSGDDIDFIFSYDNKTLKVPVLNANGEFTKRYFTYKFDGHQFVYDKNAR